MLAHVAPVTTSYETSSNLASLNPRTSHHHIKNHPTGLHQEDKLESQRKYDLHKFPADRYRSPRKITTGRFLPAASRVFI